MDRWEKRGSGRPTSLTGGCGASQSKQLLAIKLVFVVVCCLSRDDDYGEFCTGSGDVSRLKRDSSWRGG